MTSVHLKESNKIEEKIAIYGGSFNPPGMHHRKVVQKLLLYFEKVKIVPCGIRPDKIATNEIDAMHRKIMTELTFGDLGSRVQIDYFDLNRVTFTRSHELQTRYEKEGTIYHVVGSDIIRGGKRGESEIHRIWEKGLALWNTLNFVILARPEFPFGLGDLPPKSMLIESETIGSSSEIRDRVSRGISIADLVVPKVKSYIEKNNLYSAKIV